MTSKVAEEPDAQRCPTCGGVAFGDHATLHKWSQHYDTMQWAVSGTLLASSALIYNLTNTNCSLELAISGPALVLISLYACFSFRAFRRRVQDMMPFDASRIFRNKWLPRLVHVNVLVHLGLLSLYLLRFESRYSEHIVVILFVAFAVVAFSIVLLVIDGRRRERFLSVRLTQPFTAVSAPLRTIEGHGLHLVNDGHYRSHREVHITMKGPVDIRIKD